MLETTGIPIKPTLENTNISWKILRCFKSFSKTGVRIIPEAIKITNIPTAISPTDSRASIEICPTALAPLESTSIGLKTVTIMPDIWLLVCSSIIPFFVTKYPAPIIISRASI